MKQIRYRSFSRRAVFVVSLWLAAIPLYAQESMSVTEDSVWNSYLKSRFFADRPILQSESVIELEAPDRAEDGAVVPVRIHAKFPQTTDQYIKTISLI